MYFFAAVLIPSLAMADWSWPEEMSQLSKLTEFSMSRSSDLVRCHSCTTMNASEIVDGSGVHPGVYLTSLLLSSIPVTSECIDPSETDDSAPLCDQGICVKINYTARHSGRTDVLRACIPRSRGVFKEVCTQFVSSAAHGTWCVCDDDMCNSARAFTTSSIITMNGQMRTIRCYSCTTMDADRLLSDVQDQNWRRWLENVRFVPNTEECNDSFAPEVALRSGVRSQECENGVCMKMWFREKNGNSQVWRSCIPNAQEQIRSDCTRITSSQGDMEVCTCDSNLCNSVNRVQLRSHHLLFILLAIVFQRFH